jgi:hypothetical protein
LTQKLESNRVIGFESYNQWDTVMPENQRAAARQQYIAYLQENRLSERDVLPVVPSVDDATKAKVDSILRQASEAGHTNIVHRYQEAARANSNDLISLMNDSLVSRFASRDIKVPSDVFVGIFPTNTLNAHVKKIGIVAHPGQHGDFRISRSRVGIVLFCQPWLCARSGQGGSNARPSVLR